MNLVLLLPEDFIADQLVQLRGRRRDHMLGVHRVVPGETLAVGLLNQQMGSGLVTRVDESVIEMRVTLDQSPPAPLPLTLILALPRPKMLKRILQTVATMGVKRLILVNSYRVEKSYWQTPILQEHNLREQLLLGLEQGKDTVLPEVILRKRFKPFVEDELPALCANSKAIVAHPGKHPACPLQLREPVTLAVGPEGGFIAYEVEKLQDVGFTPVSLGDRILRVETAIPVMLAKLFD